MLCVPRPPSDPRAATASSPERKKTKAVDQRRIALAQPHRSQRNKRPHREASREKRTDGFSTASFCSLRTEGRVRAPSAWLSSIWPPPSHGGNETRLLVVNLYSFFLIHGSVRIVFFSISSRRALSCLLCLYLMTIVALNNWRGDLVSNRYMQC
jgi:hypothetical protein